MAGRRRIGAVGGLLRGGRLPVSRELALTTLVWKHDAPVEDAARRGIRVGQGEP